jgi:urea transport system permease protein
VNAYVADWASSTLAQVVTFVLVVLFLQVKPQGLFTVRTRGLA